ncbi:MAG: hypothetical protein COZ21_11015 [Bacteroidetes bacterium CG_4_10_14_3_um_filter_31_20]|nr:MAG: hypothetical protein COZ21_11015 [Bacteroidetes bacterium CG_4_10_14_3_um_filter_31_20]
MSKDTYEPDIITLNYLAICDIVFDESLDVTIYGYTFQDKSEKIELELYSNLVTLKNIISCNKENGNKILDLISSSANFKKDEPINVDFEEPLDGPLIIENIELDVYSPYFQNEVGEWVPNEEMGYIIDDFRVMTN